MSSPLWQQGSLIKLWGAEAFLKPPSTLVSEEDAAFALLQDLTYRTQEKLFLCYSDLSTSGQEQLGAFDSLRLI